MQRILLLSILSIILISISCSPGNNDKIIIPKLPYEKLSDYNFFIGRLADLTPSDRVLPYDLNSPLFSDYAYKARFVWMPEGQSAQYTLDHVLEFPIGTALIKTFYYNYDETKLKKEKRILETRILINRGMEWDAYGYIWNDKQTEALLEIVGDIKEVSWINEKGTKQSVDYIIPNKNQCKSCHAHDNILLPIGPKVRNLNKDFEYAAGTMNQLKKWAEVGYLTGLNIEDNQPSVAVWDDEESYSLHERAMAYLDINCGHCHNPKGAGNTSGLTLLADSKSNRALGIYKATVSAGAGTGGHTYSIVPGQPENSIMVFRMESNNPGAMMPELGRRLVHNEGVALISDWIKAMHSEDYEKPISSSLN